MTVRARTTKAKRDGAIGRILRGESTVEEESRKLHVKPGAIRAWVTMAKNGTRVGPRPRSSEGSPGSVDSSSRIGDEEPGDTSPRLERALRSAELEDGDPAASDGEPSSSSVPPPEPEELVAFMETIRGQALKLYAGVIGLSPDDPRLASVVLFTDRERATLKLWAPYAAKYVPILIGKSEEVGAWIFVGVNVASLWTAMAEVRRMVPKKKHRDPTDRFNPQDPSVPPTPSGDPSGPIDVHG